MAYLEVERKALRQALRTLSHAMNLTPHRELVLSFEVNQLVIGCVGASTGIDASGRWSGRAILPSRALLRLARLLPSDDPIRLEVQGGRLSVGTVTMPCEWLESRAVQIELPLNPSLPVLLSVARAYSRSEIESRDVRKLVDEAEKRAAEIMSSVHRTLEPFNIPEGAVTRFVETFIPTWTRESGDSSLAEDQQGLGLRVAGEQIELADDLPGP